MKPDYNHAPQSDIRVARHRCPKALPSSHQMANNIMAIEVAGAYVRKATYRRSESDYSPLSVGGRKSREITGSSRHGRRRRRSPSPLPQGAGRTPGPLRQQAYSEDRLVRRPPGRRVVKNSGPPSCSRRSSQLWFVVRAKHDTDSQKTVDWAKVGKEPKTITAASTGRTVLRTSLRVAGQASVIHIRRFRI